MRHEGQPIQRRKMTLEKVGSEVKFLTFSFKTMSITISVIKLTHFSYVPPVLITLTYRDLRVLRNWRFTNHYL